GRTVHETSGLKVAIGKLATGCWPEEDCSFSFLPIARGPVASGPISGWGGRIRTSGWRNQNPLPYHLATPQRSARLERASPESGRTIVRAPRHRNGRQDEICAVSAFAAGSTIRNRLGRGPPEAPS